jgi:hypothetical protein
LCGGLTITPPPWQMFSSSRAAEKCERSRRISILFPILAFSVCRVERILMPSILMPCRPRILVPCRPIRAPALSGTGCSWDPPRCVVRPRSPAFRIFRFVRSRPVTPRGSGVRYRAVRGGGSRRLGCEKSLDIAVRQRPRLARSFGMGPKRPVAWRWRQLGEPGRFRQGRCRVFGKNRQHSRAHGRAAGHDNRRCLEEAGHVEVSDRRDPPPTPL